MSETELTVAFRARLRLAAVVLAVGSVAAIVVGLTSHNDFIIVAGVAVSTAPVVWLSLRYIRDLKALQAAQPTPNQDIVQ